MLTNNKKGLFVKGISMMLAVLMVLAVALTGCTDSDAQKKIDELQTVVDNKANKADVTTEVSAAIANALKDYLKTNDAVTEAAVKELINSSVADFAKKSDLNNLATKEALKGYVTSDELKKLVTTDALTNALKGYVKSSDLNGLVTNEALKLYVKSEEFNALKESLKSYVTSDDVTKAIEAYVATEAFKQAVKNIAGNSLSKDEIEQIVKDVLAEGKYTNEDYVKNAIDDTLKNYFGELDAETVLKILTEQKKLLDAKDSPMTESEWNAATELVIATINSIKDTFSKIRGNIYTAANKAAINAAVKPLGITVFNANGSFANTAGDETKLIEYRILRVADVKEIQALKTAVEAAGAVETFNDEWTKIEKALYALGENVTVKKSNRKDDDTTQKYSANGTYHGVSVSNGQVKLTQVVTYADKAAFQALCEQIDKLIVKYGSENLLDLPNMNTPFAASNIRGGASGLKDVYKKVEKAHTNNVTYVIVPAGTYKSSPYANKDLTGITPTDPTDASTYTYTYVTTTAFFNGTAASMAYGQQDPTRLYSLDMSALGTVTLGTQYTAKYAGTQYAADGTITYTKLDSDVGATITSAANADSYKEWLGAYTAVVAMLTDCNDYVNNANTVFKKFVTDAMGAKMGVAADKRDALWTTTSNNQTLVDALDASLSEPNGTNSYPYYLTNGTSKLATVDGTGLVDYRKIVSAGVDAALLINGGSQAGLARYDLYLELIAKSNAALFPKYQALALKVLDRMYNDFNSVVVAASQGVVGNASGIDLNGINLRQLLNTENFTPEFLAAYMNATSPISYQIGPKNIAFPGLKGLYANNGLARILSDNRSQTIVQSDVLTTLKNNALTLSIELKASTVGVRAEINRKSAQDVADGSIKAMNAFDELLNQALANLNEVMYRYQVEDIKKAVLNEVTAYAEEKADYYSTLDHAKAAPLTTALQQYLTGASKTGVEGFTFNTTTVNGSPVTTVVSKENSIFAGFNNRAFYDELTAITVNMRDSIDGVVIGTTGTQAYNKVMDAKAAVKATIENMSVKYNYNDYLDDASTNARMAMYSYTQLSVNWTYENILAFQAAYNQTLGVLTIEQYNHNRDGIALEKYKTQYISKVLEAIIKKGDEHSKLVNGKATPADAFAEMLKAVKSSQPVPKAGATWATGPVRPIANFGTGAAATVSTEYLYAGSLVVALDKIANAKTTYTWTENGAVKTANLY